MELLLQQLLDCHAQLRLIKPEFTPENFWEFLSIRVSQEEPPESLDEIESSLKKVVESVQADFYAFDNPKSPWQRQSEANLVDWVLAIPPA